MINPFHSEEPLCCVCGRPKHTADQLFECLSAHKRKQVCSSDDRTIQLDRPPE